MNKIGKGIKLMSDQDVKKIKKKINCKKKKLENDIKKIKGIKRYEKMFGEIKVICQSDCYEQSIKCTFLNNWYQLTQNIPIWSYPIIYNYAKESANTFWDTQPESMAARSYAKETVKILDEWFEKNKINKEKYIH